MAPVVPHAQLLIMSHEHREPRTRDAHPDPTIDRVRDATSVTEGILLYESDPKRRVEFETHTRRLYFDFLPFIERDAREALLRGG